MARTPSVDKNGMKKGAWSPEEDEKLRAYVERYGHWNWRQLPKYAGLSRCGKSCRLRWINYLCPNVKRGKYTKEEDDLIMKLHEKVGNKWSAIATKLPGRTDNEIKNYWNTHLKKRLTEDQAISHEPKEQAVETTKSRKRPQCKVLNKKSTQTAPNDDADTLRQAILESTPLSAEPSSSELSSSTSNCEVVLLNDINLAVEPIGDFWTEPFLEDTMNDQNEFSSYLVEGGFMSAYSNLYYNEDIDLIYQLLQDFPKNI